MSDEPQIERSVLEPRIERFEREFPRTTNAGRILGKILRGICAFFYSLGHALMTEEPKKPAAANGKKRQEPHP